MYRWFFAAFLTTVATGAASRADAQVTYARDIAPIIADHCATCHHPGAAAPFSLLTYDDVRPRARDIVRAITTRQMPPWKPEPGHGEFIGERRLGDDQIALFRRWADDGFRRGDFESRPVHDWNSPWQFGTPDLVLAMPDPFILPAGAGDVFRSFVIPIPISDRRYVKAVEFAPGSGTAIHHANIKIDPTRFSRRWDENEPGPGYEGGGSRHARFPDGNFLGWTPGQSPRIAPRDMAWQLEPASDLVVELHLVRGAKPEAVRFSVGLFFTVEAPTRTPYMLRVGRQNIDIPAGERAYVNADSYTLPVDVQLLAVQPHAHYLAREIRGVATLPDGTTRELIYIKDWDFHWQDVYTFRTPLSMPRGTTISIQYVYDNSSGNVRNPNRPPKRVTFGQTSASEMGDLWLQVLPGTLQDREVLDRDFMPKMTGDDIAGLEKWLETEPRNAQLHAELAAAYADEGRSADAIGHLEEAARLDPVAGRFYDLGLALVTGRKFDRAMEVFGRALELRPQFSEAVLNLGVIAHAQGRFAEAVGQYTRAIRLGLDDTSVHYNLGRALSAQGRHEEAAGEYRRTIQLKPEDAEAHRALGNALSWQRRTDEAIVEYRRALQLEPDMGIALIELAWILARSERPDLRDPAEAVRLAARAAELTGRRDPVVLDALAAAYMAADQIDRAIENAEAALTLAASAGDVELSRQLRARLESYRQRQ